ncbi:MAG: hypothetical protein E6Q97_39220 [Desulfurellales bacterium]|nr:MAG: hypothetical protein E6Q97_39220 [Desulfurellales bacterium]
MKLTAILLGTNSRRVETHQLMVEAVTAGNIDAARDFLVRRAALLNLSMRDWSFERGEVRVWASA